MIAMSIFVICVLCLGYSMFKLAGLNDAYYLYLSNNHEEYLNEKKKEFNIAGPVLGSRFFATRLIESGIGRELNDETLEGYRKLSRRYVILAIISFSLTAFSMTFLPKYA
jgi:hypothetical protein